LYPASQSDLWDAVTNADRIPRWFLPVSGDLRLGGHYQLEGAPHIDLLLSGHDLASLEQLAQMLPALN
jgi:hypothetical protein